MTKKEETQTTTPFPDLIAALAEMENVGANRINPAFKARYVSLDALLDAVKPVLAKHNLALVQVLESEDGKIGISTSFVHASGHLFSFGKLLVKSENLTAQQAGGALTYIRRQSIQTACGISVDLDDDGTQASAPHKAAPKYFMGDQKHEAAALDILIKKGWLSAGQQLTDLSEQHRSALNSAAFQTAVTNQLKA